MTFLIVDAKEFLNTFALARGHWRVDKEIASYRATKLSVDVIVMSGSCNCYLLRSGFLGFPIQALFIGCLIAEN